MYPERRKNPPIDTKMLMLAVTEAIDESLEKKLPPVVEKTVNGHIKRLQSVMEDHIESDTIWKEKDKVWKDQMKPVFESAKELGGVGAATKTGVSLYAGLKMLAGIVATCTGIVAAAWGMIKIIPKL